MKELIFISENVNVYFVPGDILGSEIGIYAEYVSVLCLVIFSNRSYMIKHRLQIIYISTFKSFLTNEIHKYKFDLFSF